MTETLRLAAKAALSVGALMAVNSASPALEATCDCEYNGCYSLNSRTCQVGHVMVCGFNGTQYLWDDTGSTCSSG
jgi:hypothetical protein